MSKTKFLALTLAISALMATPAPADVIELADGRMIQGEILPGQTTDTGGLAVRMFDTGGVVVVRWNHVLPERAKSLRLEYGIDIPADESVMEPGHIITLTNDTQVRGVALNFDEYQAGGSTLRVKTPNGIQTYDRSAVARVVAVEIEAKEAYTTEELYTRRIEASPPQSAADHFALGDYCQSINDYEHALEHYQAAQADPDFAATNDGKSLDARIRRVEILIRAKGAQDYAEAIQRATYQKNWNLALEKLKELDAEFEDPQIRDAIGFDRLESRVVRGRDDFFKRRVQSYVYDSMERMMRKKASEKKPLRADEESSTMAGTLAGARQWAVRELPTELWDKVSSDLGLEKEEVDRYWGERAIRRVRTANYGTGSFIVVKRATLPGGEKKQRRPPPGSRSRGNNAGGGGGAPAASRPKSDEEWWSAVRPNDRARWLESYFVENSGIFEIIRTDESDLCSNCAGKGVLAAAGGDGGDGQTHCPQCNGSGKFRKVLYR